MAERQGVDLRYLPTLVPESYLNETARIIEAELLAREARLRDKVDSGNIEESPAG